MSEGILITQAVLLTGIKISSQRTTCNNIVSLRKDTDMKTVFNLAISLQLRNTKFQIMKNIYITMYNFS